MDTQFKTITLENGEISIAYNIKNDASPVMCFIHGAGGNFKQYMPVAEKIISECSYVAIDLPAHGGSVSKAGASLDLYAETVCEVMKALSVESFVPIGHSMGGGVILEIFKKAKEKVAGLIFLSTGARIKVNSAVFEMINNDFEAFTNFAGKLSFSPDADMEAKSLMADGFAIAGKEIVFNDFTICNTYDYTDLLSSIDVPVLVLAGSGDKMIPAGVSEKLAAGIKNAELKIYDYNGHMLQCEIPSLLAEDITRFSKKL